MIFKIMTDEELQQSDEATLRLRVRELTNTLVRLDMREDTYRVLRILNVMAERLEQIDHVLKKLAVEIVVEKTKPKARRRKTKRKTRR